MRNSFASLALACALGFTNTSVLAADAAPNIPQQKQTQLGLYLSAQQAYEMKKSNADKVLFVDVRTSEEYEYVGHAVSTDMNIPYMKTDYSTWDSAKNVYKMEPNSNFLVALEEALKARKMDKTATIIFMCRSGDRSANAVNLMAKAGYTHVYSVYDGFEGDVAKSGDVEGKRMVNGWKNAGLPWEYKMDKTKVYMEQFTTTYRFKRGAFAAPFLFFFYACTAWHKAGEDVMNKLIG